jgi:N-acetylmuramoyl-L-alanine amidase
MENAGEGGGEVKRVYIDAGHGGVDSGNTKGGMLEKVTTLDLAQRVARNIRLLSKSGNINSEPQILPRLSREKDVTLGINSRALIARQQCDLLVSLHTNSGVSWAHGADVFVSHGGSSVHKAKSAKLGRDILGRLEACGLKNRGVHPDQKPFIRYNQLGLLAGVCWFMPAVLVECGFASNDHDARMLRDPQAREVMAVQIAAACVKALGIEPRMDLAG